MAPNRAGAVVGCDVPELAAHAALEERSAIVLDTNVVLDWLLFGRPSLVAVGRAIVGGDVQWIVSAALRVEFALVVERGIRGWRADPAALLAAWDRWSTVREATPSGLRPGRLRCSDASDQKFIDLAVAEGATALLSRDRAVLKVARRAREHGVAIVTPERWAAEALGSYS